MIQTVEANRLFLFRELKSFWGVPFTKQHLKRLEIAGKFPKRIRMNGSGRCAWVASELAAWVEKQKAARV